jgi:hypothetical protein
MSTGAMIAVGASGPFIGLAIAFLLIRHLAAKPVQQPTPARPDAPPCDRCGNDTGKPWLWLNTRTRWTCDRCEREVTDQMLDTFQKINEHQDAMLRIRAGMRPREGPTG